MIVSSRVRRAGRRCTVDARRGTEAGADPCDQAVLAAVAGVRPEVDRLVLPGGIERREVGRSGSGSASRADNGVGLGLRRRERHQRCGKRPRRPTRACAAARPERRRYGPVGRAVVAPRRAAASRGTPGTAAGNPAIRSRRSQAAILDKAPSDRPWPDRGRGSRHAHARTDAATASVCGRTTARSVPAGRRDRRSARSRSAAVQAGGATACRQQRLPRLSTAAISRCRCCNSAVG